MAEIKQAVQKRTKSPGYAVFDLETAIGKAKAIYDAEKKNAANVDILYKHVGYSGKSGPALSAIATLKRYGLLEKVGVAQLKLTKRALAIILLDDTSPNKSQEIKGAALGPEIHRHLWEKFGSIDQLPSEANLKHYLISDLGFNPDAAVDVVRVYKNTIEFAKILENDVIPMEASDSAENGDDYNQSKGVQTKDMIPLSTQNLTPNRGTPPPTAPGVKDATFPLSTGSAFIRYPINLTRDDREQLFAYIDVWKKGVKITEGNPAEKKD